MDIFKMYINGEWVEAISKKTRDVFNPATGELVATVADGGAEEVELAVDAACEAEKSWRNTNQLQRAAMLNKAADLLQARTNEIALQECRHTGRLLRTCMGDVAGVAMILRYYAGIIGTPSAATFNCVSSLTTFNIREPIGVCGMLIPWNAPISVASKLIVPALAAGNSVVAKPSSNTPLGAIELFKALEGAGIPKGVANLVLGPGGTVGEAIGRNMRIGKVSLTGGTDTGRDLIRASAGNIKKLNLELGGKSPLMLFDDGDVDLAINNIMQSVYSSAGQLCIACTRILVQEGIYDEFCTKLVEKVKKIRVGLTEDPETEMGPLISKTQLERVLGYIEIGKKEGATLACGGYRITDEPLAKGNYIAPTVFKDVTNDMRIAQEEIFGPVLCVEKFTTEKEAFALANDSIYGLGAGIFTTDSARTWRFTKEVKAGCMWVNTYGVGLILDAPVSCTKQSGYGTLMGTACLESYMDSKQVTMANEPFWNNWFKAR